jgi:hypothetical protein
VTERRPARRRLSTTVATGDRRAALEAVRDKLAGLLERANARTAPALARQLQQVLRDLHSLPGGGEVSKLDRIAAGISDELESRRAARRPHREPDAESS